MSKEFVKKMGSIVQQLALDLLNYEPGDYLISFKAMEDKYHVSRGTIQNALKYLRDAKAVVCKSRGHLGLYIEAINYIALHEHAFLDSIMGTMTLPYSKRYEGLATGLYESFNQQKIRLNMAYVRGSENRIESVMNGVYQFAVVSLFAYNQAITRGDNIEKIIELGSHTYVGKHVLILEEEQTVADGMRVAIDSASIDQTLLTMQLVNELEVELVDVPGHQIMQAVKHRKIDAGIWNFDEIEDKKLEDVHYEILDFGDVARETSTAVVIVQRGNEIMKKIIQNVISVQKIADIQQEVVNGTRIPSY